MDGSAQTRPFRLALDEPARKINPHLPEGVNGQTSRPIVAGAVELEPGEQGAGRDPLGDAARRAGVSREQYATAVLDVQAAFRRAEALELEDGPSGLDDWLRYNARAGR